MKKAIFGLFLSLFMLIAMNIVQKNSTANLGWAVSAAYGADANTSSQNVVGGAVGGAGVAAAIISGAEVGAEIGVFGGVAGVAAGAIIGGL